MTLLKDRRAIVTGGGHPAGIGQATARLLAEHGASVAVFDRSFPAAGLPAGQVAREVDVADPEACRAAVAEVAARFGGLDILVNNAGIVAPTRIPDLTAAEFARMLEVNLIGTFNMTQAALPHLRESRLSPPSSISARSPRSAAGGFSAARTTRRPRAASSASPRRRRASADPPASAPMPSRRGSSKPA